MCQGRASTLFQPFCLIVLRGSRHFLAAEAAPGATTHPPSTRSCAPPCGRLSRTGCSCRWRGSAATGWSPRTRRGGRRGPSGREGSHNQSLGLRAVGPPAVRWVTRSLGHTRSHSVTRPSTCCDCDLHEREPSRVSLAQCATVLLCVDPSLRPHPLLVHLAPHFDWAFN